MDEPPSDRCGHTFSLAPGLVNPIPDQNCCYRKSYKNYDSCIWHVELPEGETKSVDELKNARTPPEIRDLNSSYTELLNGAVLRGIEFRDEISFEGAYLRGVDFEDSNFNGGNLSKTQLFQANLKDATLMGTNLSDAHLESTEVVNTHFSRANLSGGRLDFMTLEDVSFREADLTNVSFQETTFDGVVLYGADLSGANMRYVEVEKVEISHETTLGRQKRAEKDANGAYDWDLIAQAHHEFKSVFSDHGFAEKARDQHFWERRARGLQAKATSDRLNGWSNPTYIRSLASRLFTGYGVRVSYLVVWMLALFLFSTTWYVYSGVEETILNNFTYSTIAFTAAPPSTPSGRITQIVVMIETFFGTLLIVLLGYILGNREQF